MFSALNVSLWTVTYSARVQGAPLVSVLARGTMAQWLWRPVLSRRSRVRVPPEEVVRSNAHLLGISEVRAKEPQLVIFKPQRPTTASLTTTE